VCDTKYFEQAVTEYCLTRSMRVKVGDLSMGELSRLLQRAQELKAEVRRVTAIAGPTPGPQPIVAALDHAEEIQ
jgi:hypothetical protein